MQERSNTAVIKKDYIYITDNDVRLMSANIHIMGVSDRSCFGLLLRSYTRFSQEF